jgi:hypothetical protein
VRCFLDQVISTIKIDKVDQAYTNTGSYHQKTVTIYANTGTVTLDPGYAHYSFDNGQTWQTSPSKTNVQANQTLTVRLRSKPINGKTDYTQQTIKIVGVVDECNTGDIKIQGKMDTLTISACNVGSSTAGTGQASYGRLFERGNNF